MSGEQNPAGRINAVLAALMGFLGVTALALAAHTGGRELLQTAGQFLLFHSGAVLGLVALRRQGLLRAGPGGLANTLLVFGPAIFAADLTIRSISGYGPFPFAAPIGGSLTLIGWLLAALALALGSGRSN